MSLENSKTILCKDIIDPDHELLIWEKWITIRKEETEHLAQKTGRAPAELAMNISENLRKDKERKIVLEHAQIEKKFGVRKSLWEQPQRLKQKCYCEPVYEVQRTRAELGQPKIIEHVGVPNRIKESEKGITGISNRKPCMKLDSSYVAYRDKREKELEPHIKKIDPFRPEIEDLIIIGQKPKPYKNAKPPLPTITVSTHIESEKDISSIYAIRINDTILTKDTSSHNINHLVAMQKESWHEARDSWSYYFNCPINKVGRGEIVLQNLGTITLRYCWKKIKVPYDGTEDDVFFFNKNENVIYPGQKQNISITFISSNPGSYSESWEVIFLNSYFFETPNKHLILNLHADALENMAKTQKKIHKLENVIYYNVLKNIARDLLEEVFIKATSVEPQIYPYKKLFLEGEMFVMKNPVCFYHQTEVNKLKDLFNEMAPNKVWDLSITSWRSVMIGNEFDDRMKYYDYLRKSHRECLKPWHEDGDLITKKYDAVKLLLAQMADRIDEEFELIPKMIKGPDATIELDTSEKSKLDVTRNVFLVRVRRNIFYMKVYEHVATTIESCAGILSSLDLNRWIHFDFCRT